MSNLLNLTDADFDAQVLGADKPVLVDFWAQWCPPCRALGPTIEELAEDFAGRAVVAKVDVDQANQVAARFGISSIPAIKFFVGGKVVDEVVGLQKKSALAERLEALLQPT